LLAELQRNMAKSQNHKKLIKCGILHAKKDGVTLEKSK
jgi:hypothetical protein